MEEETSQIKERLRDREGKRDETGIATIIRRMKRSRTKS